MRFLQYMRRPMRCERPPWRWGKSCTRPLMATLYGRLLLWLIKRCESSRRSSRPLLIKACRRRRASSSGGALFTPTQPRPSDL
jgi:hypothetical protein